jgi:hypothetical protein
VSLSIVYIIIIVTVGGHRRGSRTASRSIAISYPGDVRPTCHNYRAILTITISQTLHKLLTPSFTTCTCFVMCPDSLVLLSLQTSTPFFFVFPAPKSTGGPNQPITGLARRLHSITGNFHLPALFDPYPFCLTYLQYLRNRNPHSMTRLDMSSPSPNFACRKPRMGSSRCPHQLNSQF